jgi:hypothetical protein
MIVEICHLPVPRPFKTMKSNISVKNKLLTFKNVNCQQCSILTKTVTDDNISGLIDIGFRSQIGSSVCRGLLKRIEWICEGYLRFIVGLSQFMLLMLQQKYHVI